MKSDKFAVVKFNNAQYKVSEGSIIEVNRIKGEPGDKLEMKDVLLTADGESVKVGTPTVDKAKVSAEIVEHKRGEKLSMMTYKAKARTRRRTGHRQELTALKITKIS